MVNTMRMTGVLSPVVTPFTDGLAPDPDRLVRHCRWLLRNDVGLAVFGTNSEGNSLAVDEKLDLLDRLVAAGIDSSRMMPGTGCCAITDTVRLTAHAVKVGCGGVLMLPPFYYKGVSDEGLFRNFAEIIERVGDDRLRVYLYNIPPVAQVAITLPLIERLLKAYPGVIAGAKDSSGDWNNCGSETFLLQTLRNGGVGCISATANVNPAPIARLHAQWQSEDADLQQERLDEIRGIFARYPMIPALKTAIAHYGGDPAWATVRPPLVELSDDQRTALLHDLDRAGFAMPDLGGH
jgi:4-hydroxy-tetrahydrodipicolinate synthase